MAGAGGTGSDRCVGMRDGLGARNGSVSRGKADARPAGSSAPRCREGTDRCLFATQAWRSGGRGPGAIGSRSGADVVGSPERLRLGGGVADRARPARCSGHESCSSTIPGVVSSAVSPGPGGRCIDPISSAWCRAGARPRSRSSWRGSPSRGCERSLGCTRDGSPPGAPGACVYVCGDAAMRELVISQAALAGLQSGGRGTSDRAPRNDQAARDRRGGRDGRSRAGRRSSAMIAVRVLVDLAAVFVAGALGALCAWTMRRYSTLSVRNTYPAAIVSAAALALAIWLKAWSLVIVAAPVTSLCLSAALCGRRWRLADLGAGEELRVARAGERRWVWQPAPVRRRRRADLSALAGRARPPSPVARARPRTSR